MKESVTISNVWEDYIGHVTNRAPNLLLFWNITNRRENSEIKTVRLDVTGMHAVIEYNKEFLLDTFSQEHGELQTRALLTNELYRLILHHCTERKNVNPAAYIASGYVIAPCVDSMGELKIKENAFTQFVHEQVGDIDKEDEYMENIVRLLTPESNDDKQGQGQGDGSGEGQGSSSDGQGDSQDGNSDAMEKAMGEAQDNVQKWGENSIIDSEVKQKFQETKSTGWGTGSSEMLDLIEKANAIPKNNAKELCRRFGTSVVSHLRMTSRMKVNRRYGLMRPGYRAEDRAKVLIAIDDSGSISREAIAKALAYFKALWKVAEIDYCFWDCECHEIESMKNFNQSKFKLHNGGTDPYCIGQKLEDEKLHYDGVVMFTDFEFNWTKKNIKCPIMMIDLENRNQKHPFAIGCMNLNELIK